MRLHSTFLNTVSIAVLVGLVIMRTALAEDADFAERFALSEDRDATLKELIPGTEDYYFYRCLHYQNTEQLDETDELLKTWIERYNRTERVREIQNRQSLLRYDQYPEQALEYLRRELGVYFNHQRDEVGRSNLPTFLNPSRISRATLEKIALDTNRETVAGFEDTAFDWLISKPLDYKRRRHLLQRLMRPDYKGFPALIIDDLEAERSGGFGSIPIHGQLLLSQLDELLRLKPELLNQTNFVYTYLSKLRPTADEDWQRNPESYEDYLDRLESFVSRLSPAHNSLKAHVLYHRLVHDRAQGQYDRQRFMDYIALPRNASYMNPEYLRLRENRGSIASLEEQFGNRTNLSAVGNDETLLRSYLLHFFVGDDSYEAFARYIENNYLRRAFAESKILNGIGDMETWFSWLTPAEYQRLRDRVDVEFSHANSASFDVDEPVALDLWIKNVDTLIVKVFEVNTKNYYRQFQREVNTDIDLDGLVANEEQIYNYDDLPLRRVPRHFEFPNLDDRGVYIIEFIGNGMSSRAIIRKGRLNYLVRNSIAGHIFTILDDSKHIAKGASLWMGGQEYMPDEDGAIVVPFTHEPDTRSIILSVGDFSTLAHFAHQAEDYTLSAGIHVDRESLRPNRLAKVLVRPVLYLNGTPVTLSVIENSSLLITSTDQQGISTTSEVKDFELSEGKESVHEFRVPDRLALIAFSLKCSVQKVSTTDKAEMMVSKSYSPNQIDMTTQIDTVHMSRHDGEYVLDVLDKTGIAKADRPVEVTLKHRDFTRTVRAPLQTDEEGRIGLGALNGITQLSARLSDGTEFKWNLTHDSHSYPSGIHGKAGQAIKIPYMGAQSNPLRSELSLIERRNGVFVQDYFNTFRIENGYLTINDLPPGDYDLVLKSNGTHITIRVTDGVERFGHILSDYRQLELVNSRPLQIVDVEKRGETVRIQLANHSDFSRVHVIATRYLPAHSLFDGINAIAFPEPSFARTPPPQSLYLSGRAIGDEYRYILDRKYATKFPGNMLERPGVLLSPWAIRKTATGKQDAVAGEAPQSLALPESEMALRSAPPQVPAIYEGDYANLDFLGGDSVVLLNLEPDENGLVTLGRGALSGRQHLQVLATDPMNTAYRQLALEEGEIPFADLRLRTGLDPELHAIEKKEVAVLDADEALTVRGTQAWAAEAYDAIEDIFALFVTLSGHVTLTEFSFITHWPDLPPEEKSRLYSKYACHEFNFFLYKKDPDFFASVVNPYIDNKYSKTFLDLWLLDEPLDDYLDPWAYNRLNIVERILLAEKLDGEGQHAKRHIDDLHSMLPDNAHLKNQLFMTALQGSSLDASGGGRFNFANERSAGEALARMPAADRKKADFDLDGNGIVLGGKVSTLSLRSELSNRSAKLEVSEQLAFFADDSRRRGEVRQLYQKLDTTEEWAENDYYHLPIEQQNASLITVNSFWRDYVERDPGAAFLSPNLAEASRSFPEMMFALSLLDLPFEAGEHESSQENGQYTLRASSPMVLYGKQIREVDMRDESNPIFVRQNFFRDNDRYQIVKNKQVDKFVTGEFLSQVVYGCQIVVTNPSSAHQKLELLLQVPQGAIPVAAGKYTDSVNLDLGAYSTTTLEYRFYFPRVGRFAHYPVHVSIEDELIAFASPVEFDVVETPSIVDTSSWEYISQFGNEDDVIAFLNTYNPHRHNLDRIAWRMKDDEFHKAVLDLLRRRHVFNGTLWSYAIQHNNLAAIREYLEHREDFINRSGAYIDTTLLTIDPVERWTYQHLEYSPLVNARAHRLGAARTILNDRFREQYARLMRVLAYHPDLDDEDLLALSYYMLLQDRVEAGAKFFDRVNRDEIESKVQYDYLATYVAFYREDIDAARQLAQQYKDYRVDRWRQLFANVSQQLAEVEGVDATVVNNESRAQRQGQLAATQSTFDFDIEDTTIELRYKNLDKVRVNYYLMDIELLFSRNPFVKQYSERFSFIRPNHTEVISLPPEGSSYRFEIPQQFRGRNVLIEIEQSGMRKSQASYAHSLDLDVIENYGQIKVTHDTTGLPQSKIYVKVFARMMDGQIRFYKDGYTDLRGRFDYASLSTNDVDYVDRFSLLVLSDSGEAIVREAAPPTH